MARISKGIRWRISKALSTVLLSVGLGSCLSDVGRRQSEMPLLVQRKVPIVGTRIEVSRWGVRRSIRQGHRRYGVT